MVTANANSPHHRFRYPEGMKVYGMVIDDRIPDALIRVGLKALRLVNVDHFVFLCLASDDIRDRVNWENLANDVSNVVGKPEGCEVRLVNSHEDLMYASLHVRIVHLPE